MSRRKSGDVWMRLRHQRGSSEAPADHALFQIAPFLLQSNLERAHRLYVACTSTNHNFVYDVMEACWRAFGADGPFDRPFDDSFPTSTPEKRDRTSNVVGTVGPNGTSLLSPDKMYLINGDYDPDLWIQDQMEIGYCSAPGKDRAFNVVLGYKRKGALGHFVDDQMESLQDEVFVFHGLSQPEDAAGESSSDFGGNIAVPPGKSENGRPEPNQRRPARLEVPPAPHGKIVLGDCLNPRRSENQGSTLIPDRSSPMAIASCVRTDSCVRISGIADGPIKHSVNASMHSPFLKFWLSIAFFYKMDTRTHISPIGTAHWPRRNAP